MSEAAVPQLVQPEPVPALAQDDVLQIQYRGAELKLSAREDGKPATSESRMCPYACGAQSKNHVGINERTAVSGKWDPAEIYCGRVMIRHLRIEIPFVKVLPRRAIAVCIEMCYNSRTNRCRKTEIWAAASKAAK